jgi:predicted nucleic acid-binding protein
MIVVADTSPLNYLVLIGHIEILPYFYQRVLVPPFVWQELQASTRQTWFGPGMLVRQRGSNYSR